MTHVSHALLAIALVAAPAAAADLIDINTADEAALESLPGIGPAKAKAIIEARGQAPFASVEDLERVKGIGAKTVEKLRPYITVGKAAAAAPAQASAPPARPPAKDPDAEPPTGKLNLNVASEAELTQLPGIGEARARSIVARRTESGPFRSLAEFRDMPGVGDKMFEELRFFLTVKVDVQSAPAPQLEAIGMRPEAARAVVAARAKKKLRTLADVRAAGKLTEAELTALTPLLYLAP